MKILNSIFVLAFCFVSIFPTSAASFYMQAPQGQFAGGECSRCIVVYGDTRTNHGIHRKVVKVISGRQPETVFHTGDMVISGHHKKSWDIFNQITSQLRENSEFFPVHGNHEKHAPDYFKVFNIEDGIPYYSVNRHGIHFTILDSEDSFLEGSPQYEWLERDLKKASSSNGVKFMAVILHQPLFSSGKHGVEEKTLLARKLIPLFKKYGVDIVFSGHDHSYERSYKDGIFYVVVAGGGAPLYDMAVMNESSQIFLKRYHYLTISVFGNELFFEVFGISDELLDSFSL